MARASFIAMVESALALALVTTAIGMAVAVPAVWYRNCLYDRWEVLESEMANAALEAATYLGTHLLWRNQPGYAEGGPFLAPGASASHSWEVPYDHQRPLLLAVGSCASYLIFVLAQGIYWSYIWQRNYAQASYKWEYVGGQTLVSPDHRYRAVVPAFIRSAPDSPGKAGNGQWSCRMPEVALSTGHPVGVVV